MLILFFLEYNSLIRSEKAPDLPQTFNLIGFADFQSVKNQVRPVVNWFFRNLRFKHCFCVFPAGLGIAIWILDIPRENYKKGFRNSKSDWCCFYQHEFEPRHLLNGKQSDKKSVGINDRVNWLHWVALMKPKLRSWLFNNNRYQTPKITAYHIDTKGQSLLDYYIPAAKSRSEYFTKWFYFQNQYISQRPFWYQRSHAQPSIEPRGSVLQ